jgi:hypothetical protein
MSHIHKVGDRVRIDFPRSTLHAHQGTVWKIGGGPPWGDASIALGIKKTELAYYIEIDGRGIENKFGALFGFPAYALKPLISPGSWSEIAKMLKTDIRKLRVTA